MEDEVISHEDVTTLMRMVADIQIDVERIRRLMEVDNGWEEEEAPEADA